MTQNTLVFDIETVPDLEAGRVFYELNDLNDEEVYEVMCTKRRQQVGHDFFALPFQRIVAISAVLQQSDQIRVWSLGDEQSTEKDLIERFYAGIEKLTPTLVTWNGGGFDLPVLHYRAMKHGVVARKYWDMGDGDREFKWNNYINRYHARHTDLMEVLSMYQARAGTSLNQMAVLLGFPGKMGLSGADVWKQFQAGQIKAIRDYCEMDVLNTFLVYTRFQLMTGAWSHEVHEQQLNMLQSYLGQAQAPAHWQEFLQAWEGVDHGA